MTSTQKQYQCVKEKCSLIFHQKMQDYGVSWRAMRLPAITDQLFIKAKRIKSVEEKGVAKINESIEDEFIGIANYAIIALIQMQLNLPARLEEEVDTGRIAALYADIFTQAENLMQNKNHDYDEAWRDMRLSSFTDLLLTKILRIKQIEDNSGLTLISEGVASIYTDMINYAVFALIRLNENNLIQ